MNELIHESDGVWCQTKPIIRKISRFSFFIVGILIVVIAIKIKEDQPTLIFLSVFLLGLAMAVFSFSKKFNNNWRLFRLSESGLLLFQHPRSYASNERTLYIEWSQVIKVDEYRSNGPSHCRFFLDLHENTVEEFFPDIIVISLFNNPKSEYKISYPVGRKICSQVIEFYETHNKKRQYRPEGWTR